jgi:hypothetical protein
MPHLKITRRERSKIAGNISRRTDENQIKESEIRTRNVSNSKDLSLLGTVCCERA